MSASTPSTVLATICVVDSSLAVAVEWAKIFSDYLTPIIQRLAELASNANQFRIGFITYGLASSRPSPLLCQRFFQPSVLMNKEMKDEPVKFSIGHTGIGSSSGGMAVLEGIVAALEMFDKLRQSIGVPPGQSQIQQPNKPPMTLISHIIHLAAAPPDGSLHPVWNANSKFDQLTWSTLQDEFKQRQMNYSIVTIRPIPRFKEIFLSANFTDAASPWFDVAPNHTVMLSGFPPKGLKRQTEPTTATPDPKRPRQDSNTKPASGASPSGPALGSESATPTTNSAIVPNSLSFANMPPAKQQEFMEKYLKLQSEIKQELVAIQKAQADASPPEVLLPMKNDLGKKIELYKRLSTILPGQKKLPASTGTVPGPSSQPPPSGAAIPTSTTTPAIDPNHSNPVPPAPEPAQLPIPSTTAVEPQNLSVPNTMAPKESYPTEVMTQIHRLMQQQNQQSLAQQGGTTQLPVVNNPSMIPRPGPRRQWHGVFSSVTANGTQEAIIYVSAEFQQNAEPHIATWPPKIQISAALEKAVTPQEFHQWASQNNGVLCKIMAQRRPETPPNNEVLLSQLINSLAEKSMSKYAVASWPLPNGAGVRKTMIMTTLRGMLMGAVFPLTGFSEMPKAGSVPQQPIQQSGQQTLQQPAQQTSQTQLSTTSIPPELTPRLHNISRDQIAMIRAMQARFGGTGRNTGLSLTGNVGDLPGSTFQSGTVNSATQQHHQIPTGVSLEVMQALMQHKQDGSG
ncbi:hypothetical protein BDM02DRAFT_3268153 [Thelephora ganbajun]|uniref:Uncharacterized protein n=1 Tax=Thelephora ganbajun TaxID=370292 RepID=A0ACB6ZLQ4_THEGA|nr:hypothetical protein BDM02DRAFT_3268153 [Thelephora ganbajun]